MRREDGTNIFAHVDLSKSAAVALLFDHLRGKEGKTDKNDHPVTDALGHGVKKPILNMHPVAEETVEMTNERTCTSCGGSKVTRKTTTIDRRTGGRVKKLNLIGGIALSAFGSWLFFWTLSWALGEGDGTILLFAFLILQWGLRLIGRYLRSDRVRRFTYHCRDCDHRWYGWEKAAGIEEEDVREWRIKALKGDDVKARRQAIKALGVDRDVKAVDPLIAALKDNDKRRVRSHAAKALGKIGNAQAVDALIAALKDDDKGRVRSHAAKALGKIGNAQAVDALIAALKDNDKMVVRSHAAKALGKIGNAQAVDPLIAVLKDENNRYVRKAAAKALGKMDDVRALNPLISAFKDEDEDRFVRKAAAKALGEIGDAKAKEALTQALQHGKRDERKAAREALKEIKNRETSLA